VDSGKRNENIPEPVSVYGIRDEIIYWQRDPVDKKAKNNKYF
jgi:hypothetical protein